MPTENILEEEEPVIVVAPGSAPTAKPHKSRRHLSLVKTALPKTATADPRRHRQGTTMSDYEWTSDARALFDRFAEVCTDTILTTLRGILVPDTRAATNTAIIRRIDVELACACLHVQCPERTQRLWAVLGKNEGRAIKPKSAAALARLTPEEVLAYEGKRKLAMPITEFANFASVAERAKRALANHYNWDALCYLTAALDQFQSDLANGAVGVAVWNGRRTVTKEDLIVVLGVTPEFVTLTRNELALGYKPPLTAPLSVRHTKLLQRHRLEARQAGRAIYQPQGGPLNTPFTYRLVNVGIFAHPGYKETTATAPLFLTTGKKRKGDEAEEEVPVQQKKTKT